MRTSTEPLKPRPRNSAKKEFRFSTTENAAVGQNRPEPASGDNLDRPPRVGILTLTPAVVSIAAASRPRV